MKFSSVLKKLLLLTILISINPSVDASQYDIDDNQNIQYFGYLGYKYLTASNCIHRTYNEHGYGTPDVGLNLIYNRNNFQIFNQFRYGSDVGTALVYNFMQYTFNFKHELDITLKGGKLRHDIGLYNASRINPTTRQGVIMPQSIYWDAFDEFMTSGTGVGITMRYKEIELSYTIDDPTIVDQEKTSRVFWSGLLNRTNTTFGSHHIISAIYSPTNQPLIVKASWMHLDFGSDTSALMQKYFPKQANKNVFGETLAFGAEYKWRDFILAGETLWFRSSDRSWDHIADISRGISVTTTYQATEYVDIRLNYNEYNSVSARKLHPEAPWMGYYKDTSIGVNYHINNYMIQVEGHHINGSRVLDPLDVANNSDDYRDWWMIGMNVVYSF